MHKHAPARQNTLCFTKLSLRLCCLCGLGSDWIIRTLHQHIV